MLKDLKSKIEQYQRWYDIALKIAVENFDLIVNKKRPFGSSRGQLELVRVVDEYHCLIEVIGIEGKPYIIDTSEVLVYEK